MKSSSDVTRQAMQAELAPATVWLGQNMVSGESVLAHNTPPEVVSELALVMEAIFHWLSKTLPVDLIVYWNPEQRKSHLMYNPLADDKAPLDAIVRRILGGGLPRVRHWRQQGWFFHLWMGAPLEPWDRLLIVEKQGSLSSEECNTLIQEAIKRFYPALRAAIKNEIA